MPVSELLTPFALDQEIILVDRITTIRKELMEGNAHTMRNFVTHAEEPEISEYWVVIYKQTNNSEMFKVTKQDFNYLQGHGIRPAFT
jgi:hypothetical protein